MSQEGGGLKVGTDSPSWGRGGRIFSIVLCPLHAPPQLYPGILATSQFQIWQPIFDWLQSKSAIIINLIFEPFPE